MTVDAASMPLFDRPTLCCRLELQINEAAKEIAIQAVAAAGTAKGQHGRKIATPHVS